MWITEYLDDIEADFIAIYRMETYDHLDGPKFIRLAERLPLFQGCLARRLEIERAEEEAGDSPESQDDGSYEGPREMSMREAVARNKGGDDLAVLDALNEDGKNSPFGALFERTVVSSSG